MIFPGGGKKAQGADRIRTGRQSALHVSFNLSIPESDVSSAQVRIFPYLIGRESAFADNLKWMACANKGLGHSDKHLSRQRGVSAGSAMMRR